MKQFFIRCSVVSALIALLAAGPAGAISELHITGWMAGGGGVKIWAQVSPTEVLSGTYGAGAFAWRLDGQDMAAPLYCLDVYHTFQFGNTWMVDPYVIPPDPADPPPYNTAEAVWAYNRYAYTNVSAEAQGLQLALWELSHDVDWLNLYENNSGNWWDTGNFQYRGDLGAAGYQFADQVLLDIYDNFDVMEAGTATYYQPTPHQGNDYFGQGQIANVIPEPGSLMLLGFGLLSVAGGAWRRRRN